MKDHGSATRVELLPVPGLPEFQGSERTLLGTEGTGWDIGYGALFLASDESRWITGITLPIDGGASAGSEASPVPPSEPAKG